MKNIIYTIALSIILISCYSCNSTIKDKGDSSKISDLYHTSEGEGHPIIVIHGGPGLGASYLENHLKELSASNQVIFYDQRNSGRSTLNTDSTKVNLKAFLSDIDAIRKNYNHDQVAILAHSWGGLLGMQYALSYPEHVSHLILMNSNAAEASLNNQANTKLANRMSADDIEARTQIMRTEAFNSQNPKAYEELMSIGFSYQFANRNLIDELQLNLPEDFGAKSGQLRHLVPDFSNYNFTSELSNLTIPTLLLYGLKDPLTPYALNSLSQIIPNNTIKAISAAGHFPFIEKKSETITAITEFINK